MRKTKRLFCFVAGLALLGARLPARAADASPARSCGKGKAPCFRPRRRRTGRMCWKSTTRRQRAEPPAPKRISPSRALGRWAQHLEFPRTWRDIRPGTRFATDYRGNEMTPEQEEVAREQTLTAGFSAALGRQAVPLTKGSYTIRLTMTREAMQVRAVRLICPERRSYAAYREETAGHPQTADESISVEAELPAPNPIPPSCPPTTDPLPPSSRTRRTASCSTSLAGAAMPAPASGWNGA